MQRMDDTTIIERYGGPAKLAERLGFGKWGTQRVHNWRTRGIPSLVKLTRPDLFGARALRRLEAQSVIEA